MPPNVMSDAVNVEVSIGWLNVAVKLMGEVFVGSVCPAACSTVTDGNVLSNVTVLSTLVLALLELPTKSLTLPAG
ncbi:hypothetical protein JZU69_00195, partial [bacterium]|nr:hypothetical protein [bacterium]